MNKKSNVKKVIGVVSGKGGVGKSSITSMLAVTAQRMGHKTAILDGDITGPSIPKAFGIEQKAMGERNGDISCGQRYRYRDNFYKFSPRGRYRSCSLERTCSFRSDRAVLERRGMGEI